MMKVKLNMPSPKYDGQRPMGCGCYYPDSIVTKDRKTYKGKNKDEPFYIRTFYCNSCGVISFPIKNVNLIRVLDDLEKKEGGIGAKLIYTTPKQARELMEEELKLLEQKEKYKPKEGKIEKMKKLFSSA